MENLKEILEKYPRRLQAVKVSDVIPNEWNPNRQPTIIYESLKKSILKYGWIVYPIVREYVGQFQIIDGEHRMKAAKELGLEEAQVIVLGDDLHEVIDADAMVLTQLLNARGQDDVLKRAELLKKLKDSKQEDLFGMMPMTIKEIESQLELLNFDFSQFEKAGLEEEEVTRGQKALKMVIDLEKELRKLHSESDSTPFRLLLEQYFAWSKVVQSNLELT